MRYLPHTKTTRDAMLKAIGMDSIDDAYTAVPSSALNPLFNLPNHKSEMEVEKFMAALAGHNQTATNTAFFLGAGCYHHHIPATVDHLIQRSEFLTAYTPYQPEVSQGTLTAMFEFQTYIARLTGQDVANASLYDGATATAEAALMARRITKRERIAVASALHPHYMQTLRTYIDDSIDTASELSDQTACLIVQNPDFNGNVHSLDKYRQMCDEVGCLLVVVITEVISLGLLPAPSCADIVCGEGQSLGNPMSFGGPHLGFFACAEKHVRQMPGRLIGETKDTDGRRSFVLTLATREQHIRRERATSNICTNQGLCALAFTIHASLLGEQGMKNLALLNHSRAQALEESLKKIDGIKIENETYFNEFTITLPTDTTQMVEDLAIQGIIAGYPTAKHKLIVTATEQTTDEDIEKLTTAISKYLQN